MHVGPLELEFQAVVGRLKWELGTELRLTGKNRQCTQPQSQTLCSLNQSPNAPLLERPSLACSCAVTSDHMTFIASVAPQSPWFLSGSPAQENKG